MVLNTSRNDQIFEKFKRKNNYRKWVFGKKC